MAVQISFQDFMVPLIQQKLFNLNSMLNSKLPMHKESKYISGNGSPNPDLHLKNLKQLDLNNLEKPKTLIIIHYKGKRLSVPIFHQVNNLTEYLYQQIDRFEQSILKNEVDWEKQSQSKIVCFQSKKQQKAVEDSSERSKRQMYEATRMSDGDLKIDILLSLFRIQTFSTEEEIEEHSYRADITKLFKYMEIEPYYQFFEEIKHNSKISMKVQTGRHNFYFCIFRVLESTKNSQTYLSRRKSDGIFNMIKVYKPKSKIGSNEWEVVELINHMNKLDQENRTANLICNNMETYFIPHPESEEESDDDLNHINNCKHLAIVFPFFVKGTLEETLKEMKVNKSSKKITEMDCLNYLKELMWGAHVLHEKYNLIHRAIIPSNLMIDENNHLKLISYVSCTECYDENGKIVEYYGQNGQQSVRSQQSDRNFNFQDTFYQMMQSQSIYYDLEEYTPPEVKKKQSYNYLVDFYTIGCVIKQLYEHSQSFQKVPVSQNHQNLMMKMINQLTSPDLQERAEIANQIIQSIEKQQNHEKPISFKNMLLLQDIKIGHTFDIGQNKKFIQNQQDDNQIQHQTVINYFKEQKRKVNKKQLETTLKIKSKSKKSSKEKNSTKNSREKNVKSKSKNSTITEKETSQILNKSKEKKFRHESQEFSSECSKQKKKQGSFSKKRILNIDPNIKKLNMMKRTSNPDSPNENVKKSKSKSHEKIKKDEAISPKLYTQGSDFLRKEYSPKPTRNVVKECNLPPKTISRCISPTVKSPNSKYS